MGNSTKLDLKDVDWFRLTEYRIQSLSLLNTVMNLQVP